MDHQYSGWSMIPNIPGASPTTSNQENLYLQQQQQQFHLQQQFQLQQQQNLFLQQQRLQYQQSPQQMQMPQQQQQQVLQSPPQPQQQQPPPQQTLASHFQLQHLVESLAETIENGTRDQHSDALVADLSSHFEKCQNLLNSIASATGSKNMTVEGQKSKLQESEQLLNQRRQLIAKFRNSVEELIKTDP
uniref:Mediator of RNA polymerase II transcription subunit 9 n=1 Tax=Kalanchoe fedtschenkoi TaxID=63787 RepID=A0A7N0U0A5_KALFE